MGHLGSTWLGGSVFILPLRFRQLDANVGCFVVVYHSYLPLEIILMDVIVMMYLFSSVPRDIISTSCCIFFGLIIPSDLYNG